MALSFREIDANNFDEVYRFNLLHEFSFRDSSADYVADSEEERQKNTRRIIERLLSGDQKYYCLAVFHDDEMIASLFQDRYEIDKQAACHIHGLWVHPEFRGKGIASKLKRMGELWAKNLGCNFMDTNVRVANQTIITLNQKLGYTVARFNFRKKISGRADSMKRDTKL